MKFRIDAITKGKNGEGCVQEYGGKMAGICYMNSMSDIDNETWTKRINRFNKTIESGHQSIADHTWVTVIMEDIPKFLAMILNSFQFYATSEKSARYTKMDNLSEEEQRLYDKWFNRITDILTGDNPVKVRDTYYNLSENDITGIARENARYFIGIFSPSTTMAYSTSVRQWNLINIWFKEFINHKYIGEDDRFVNLTKYAMEEFVIWFEDSVIYDPTFTDPINRKIKFLLPLYIDDYNVADIKTKDMVMGNSYTFNTYMSFACLAQLERHRTISYTIEKFKLNTFPAFFNTKYLYFVPAFLDETDVTEWINDMESIKSLYPQGIMVEVREEGTIDKFLLKCNERLCGRAQFESMRDTRAKLKELAKPVTTENWDINKTTQDIPLSNYSKRQISRWIDTKSGTPFELFDGSYITPKPKCEVCGKCNEKKSCIWGPHGALTRIY